MIRFIQVLMVLSVLLLFGWTAWLNLTPNGLLEARYSFDKISPFITSLLPGDRALPIAKDENGKNYQGVIGDPVYFRLKPSRAFDQATVQITFQNSLQPILEVGGLAGRNPDVFDLRPLENKIIDDLSWPVVWNNEVNLYERQPRFRTVEEFLANLPPREQIATYHARVNEPFRIPGYYPTDDAHIIDASLRGAHNFYAYVKNETLDVTFWVQDMNRDPGGDPITITVYGGGTPVGTVSDLDENRIDNGQSFPIKLSIPGLPEGAYRLELRTSRDVFIRKIETRSKKFVVADSIFLGDEVGYEDLDRPVTLWTSGRLIRALTVHADGAQELMIGNEVLRISESHKEYARRVTTSPPTKIFSPQGDLQLRTNGVFAFSAEALFAPEPVRLSFDTELDTEGINYILTDYVPPREKNGWKTASATFDLTKLLWEDRAVPLVISAPGIAALQNEVRIGEIKVSFEREPQSVAELVRDSWNKIKELLFSSS